MIVEALAPQLSHNTKMAFKIANKMCKRDPGKKDEVLTAPEMLEDYKKKPRHSKQIKKIRMAQLVTFIVHCGNQMQRTKRGLYSTYLR